MIWLAVAWFVALALLLRFLWRWGDGRCQVCGSATSRSTVVGPGPDLETWEVCGCGHRGLVDRGDGKWFFKF